MNADKAARDELLRLLDQAGLVTVTVGELENFDKDASTSSKDAWLQDALTNGAYKTPEVAAHIRRLLEPRTNRGARSQAQQIDTPHSWRLLQGLD